MIEGGTIKLLFRRMNMYIARSRRRHAKRTAANDDKVTLMKREERAITLQLRPEAPRRRSERRAQRDGKGGRQVGPSAIAIQAAHKTLVKTV